MHKCTIAPMMFPGMLYGTHQSRHDMKTLLYVGGASTNLTVVNRLMDSGELGQPELDRLPLVQAIYDGLCAKLAAGQSNLTIRGKISAVRHFYSWCEHNNRTLYLDTVEESFRAWVEHLVYRVRIKKNLKNSSAYSKAQYVDRLLSPILGFRSGILNSTRLLPPKKHKTVLGTEAEKQNLHDLFTFGHFLLDITKALTSEVIAGPLPVIIKLRNGLICEEWSGLRPDSMVKSFTNPKAFRYHIERIRQVRGARSLDGSSKTRYPLINLRIEAELLIFLAQTGINLSQAVKLQRGHFRFQNHGDEVSVFRVYKGRKVGEAEFRIFKEYAKLFKSYLLWLNETTPDTDNRLFPFIYPHRIPHKNTPSRFSGIGRRSKQLGIKFFGARDLRKLRINWLLRQSKDLNLVAEMAQHTKQTLMLKYEQPNHQIAAVEITRFHKLTDPSITPPSPGSCSNIHKRPVVPEADMLSAPQPDCINASGCLFCKFHRDLDSQDYVWGLASFRFCKMLELDRYTPPHTPRTGHPAQDVIDRISHKLEALAKSSQLRSSWVEESKNLIREGRYHPNYDGLIQLMELAE